MSAQCISLVGRSVGLASSRVRRPFSPKRHGHISVDGRCSNTSDPGSGEMEVRVIHQVPGGSGPFSGATDDQHGPGVYQLSSVPWLETHVVDVDSRFPGWKAKGQGGSPPPPCGLM